MTAVQRWRVCFAVSALLIAAQAQALKFKLIQDGQVLLIYDCPLSNNETCQPHETRFSGPSEENSQSGYAGDAATFRQWVRQHQAHWRQVWLLSGGGNLNEGLELGKLFREHNAFVFVPKGGRCVSACTVAFLGGLLRDIDPEGRYEVHAYSGMLEANRDRLSESFQEQGGSQNFAQFIRKQSESGRAWAVRLLDYVQNMIGGQSQRLRAQSLLDQATPYHQAYAASPQLEADVADLQQAGASRIQEILMRIEREAFLHALSVLRAHQTELGVRAPQALDMLEIMFSSRIAGTFSLDRNTLRERGYINVRR